MKTPIAERRKRVRTKTSSRTGKNESAGQRSTEVIDLVPALLRIKLILVPIDFSVSAEKALDYAVAFADQFGARITVLNVVEAIVVPEYASLLVNDNGRMMKAARAKLNALCERKNVRRVVQRTLVRCGAPFHEITGAARTLKADLIVISTHGFSGLKHMLLGSTTERVVRYAPCPVLVVREREHEFLAT